MIVNTVFDSVTNALSAGQKVELRGFGSFHIRHRNPQMGRNPKSGAKAEIPAKRLPFFKAGKELREMVNNKKSN